MNELKFKNQDLQRDSLGEPIDLNPEDIIVEHDKNLNVHILTIQDTSYFYPDVKERDHDRNLAMALLLKSMSEDDGVELTVNHNGDKTVCTIDEIRTNSTGGIYAIVTDEQNNFIAVDVKDISAQGYIMPLPRPGHIFENLSNIPVEQRETYVLEKQSKVIRLGDYVEAEFHGHKGRVTGIAQYFADTNESNQWFRAQTPAYDKSQKMERWISILCHNGGSVMVAESRVKQIGKFAFKNPYAAEYFADHKE